MARHKSDVGRIVGICDEHYHRHCCDDDCSKHKGKNTKWDLIDHLKRLEDHDDDSDICAVSRCGSLSALRYQINEEYYGNEKQEEKRDAASG